MLNRLLLCALLVLPVSGCAGISPWGGYKLGYQSALLHPDRPHASLRA